MAEHNAPFAHIAYQHPDGTTGVLDNHDAEAIHDDAATVKTENLEDGSVTNGKIAPDAVTGVELAAESVSKEHLSPEMLASWDSLSRQERRVHFKGYLVPRGYANVPLPSVEGMHAESCRCEFLVTSGAPVVTSPITDRSGGVSTRIVNANDAEGAIEGDVIVVYGRS